MSSFGLARSFSGSLALARSMPGYQAATFEIASTDRAAGLASDTRSHVVTENQLDQRACATAFQARLVTRRESDSSVCQSGLDIDPRAHRSIRKTTLRFPKASVEPLRATESHCRATPNH